MLNFWKYTRYLMRDERGFLGIGAIAGKLVSKVPGVNKVVGKVSDFGGGLIGLDKGRTSGACPGQPSTQDVANMLAVISPEDLARLRSVHARGHKSAFSLNDPFALAKNIFGGKDCKNPSKEIETRNVFIEMMAKYANVAGTTPGAQITAEVGATQVAPVGNVGLGGQIKRFFGDLFGIGKGIATSAVEGGIRNAREDVAAAKAGQEAAAQSRRLGFTNLLVPAALVVGTVVVGRKLLK